jgi:hypothetical protein
MKRMKKLNLSMGMLSFLLLSFCTKEETPLFTTFPATFIQNRVEKIQSKVFVKTIDGYEKIDLLGTFQKFDADAYADFESNINEVTAFNYLIFDSDTQAKVKNDIIGNDNLGLELEGTYTSNNSSIELIINPDSGSPINIQLVLDATLQEVKATQQSVKFSKKNATGQNTYSPFNTLLFSTYDLEGTVKNTIQEHNLSVGDTIAVLSSNIIFTKQ